MAISKILYIGDCGAGYAGKHLKQALDYITVPEKTPSSRYAFLIPYPMPERTDKKDS